MQGIAVVQQSAGGHVLEVLTLHSAGAQGVCGCAVLQGSGGQGSPFGRGVEAVLRLCAC